MGGKTSPSSSSEPTDKRIVADGAASVISLDSKNSTTSIVTSDFGAIAGSLAVVRELGLQALLGSAATASQAQQNTRDISAEAFDLASTSSEAAYGTVAKALGYVDASGARIGEAYKLASDQVAGNRTLAITGLIIAGVVTALAFSQRRA